jgi:hypothetical protein
MRQQIVFSFVSSFLWFHGEKSKLDTSFILFLSEASNQFIFVHFCKPFLVRFQYFLNPGAPESGSSSTFKGRY